MKHTPYSKMAATQDSLGRVARKRGIEGHGTEEFLEATLCPVLVQSFVFDGGRHSWQFTRRKSCESIEEF